MKKRALFLLSSWLMLPLALWAEDGGQPRLLNLAEAQARAENHSSDLRSLNLQLLTQRYAYQLGLRAFFPSVSLGINQSDSVTFYAADSAKTTVSLSLHQPLFDGGRSLFNRQVQKLALTLQEYDYLQKREELSDQTWSLFHNILLSMEKRRLQEELYRISLQQLLIAKKERELGATTEIDFIDTELEVKKLESEMRKTKMDEEVIVYQFQTLCGLPREQALRLDGKIDFSYGGLALWPHPDFWLGVALERNTEIRRLRFETEKSREEYRIAQTTFIPTIGADFTFSLSGEGFPLYEPGFAFKLTFQFPFNEAPTKVDLNANSSTMNQRSTAAGVSADVLPSLDFLSDRRLALLKIQLLNLQVESSEETLRFNIEQFLKNYAYEVENLKLQKETLHLLDRKQRVTREQLGIGEIKRIDYVKAQNEFYRQEIAIRENILKILLLERSFEQLLGLEAGELVRFLEKPPAPDGGTKEEVP